MAFLKKNTTIKLCDCELRNSTSIYTDTYNEFYGQAEEEVDLLFILEHKEKDWMISEFLDEIKKQCKRNNNITYAVIYALNCTQKNYVTNNTLRPFVECKKNHVKKKIEYYKPKVILTVGKSIYTITESKDLMVQEDKDNPNKGGHFYALHEDDSWLYSSEFNCRVYPIAPLYLFAGFDNYEKEHFKKQIDRAIQSLKLRQVRKTEIKYEKLNKEQAYDYFQSLLNSSSLNVVSIDTETDGFDYWNGKLNNITIATNLDLYRGYFIYWEDVNRDQLIKLFNKQNINFIFHNYDFDGKWLISKKVFNSRCDFDTMIASAHINSNSPSGLKPNTWLYTQYGGYEKELKDFIEQNEIRSYLDIPESILIKYAVYDAVITLHLYYYFKQRLEEETEKCRWNFYEVRMKALPMLVETEMRGIPFNTHYCYTYADILKQKAKEIENEIYTIAGREFNINSNKQLTEILLSIDGFKPIEEKGNELYTKNGDLVLNKETLNTYSEKYPFAKKIVEYNHIQKEISQLGLSDKGRKDESEDIKNKTKVLFSKNKSNNIKEDDIIDFSDEDENEVIEEESDDILKFETSKEKGLLGSVYKGRLYGNYSIIGTSTGRLSSGGGLRSKINLMNFPKTKEFRKLYLPENGYIFLETDYKTLEVNIDSQMAGKGSLEKVLLDKLDMHVYTGVTAIKVMDKQTLLKFFTEEELNTLFIYENDRYNISYEDFLRYATDDYHMKKSFVSFRKYSKFVNFSSLYNTTKWGISRLLNIDPDTAQKFLEAFYNAYPEVKQFIDDSIKTAKEQGFLQTPLGLVRRFPKLKYSKVRIENSAMEEILKKTNRYLYSIISGQCNTASNFCVQSLAGQSTIISMIEINEEFKKMNFKSRMIANVHDSILFEVKLEELDNVIEIVERIMCKKRWENVEGNEIKLQVDSVVGSVWGFGKGMDYWKNNQDEWQKELDYIKEQNKLNKEFRII